MLGSALIVLALASLADHFILPRLAPRASEEGFLFPPGVSFPYQTPEFSHSAVINSLGFRDREWPLEKTDATIRILAIGDSFTFGMGVELEYTWTKVLEKMLQARGHQVEIANLGKPGTDPFSYAETAKKAVPLLNPDIVLVAILQGDDLAQTMRQLERQQTGNSYQAGRSSHFVRAIHFFYPYTSAILRERSRNSMTFRSRDRLLEKIWQDQALELAAGYRGEKKKRFDAMGEAAREMFLKGQLNPGIVSMAMADPFYFAAPLETEEPAVQNALNAMENRLRAIRDDAAGSLVVVMSIPLGAYVSRDAWQSAAETGFATFPEMLRTTTPDDSLRNICDGAGIPFVSVTEQFRRQSGEELFYYTFDGHFNARGHEFFADQVLLFLEEQISSVTKQ